MPCLGSCSKPHADKRAQSSHQIYSVHVNNAMSEQRNGLTVQGAEGQGASPDGQGLEKLLG